MKLNTEVINMIFILSLNHTTFNYCDVKGKHQNINLVGNHHCLTILTLFFGLLAPRPLRTLDPSTPPGLWPLL